MKKNAKDILIAARELVLTPEQWGQGPWRNRPTTCCAAEAIENAAAFYKDYLEQAALAKAFTTFELVCSGGELNTVDWNDAAERTHANVLAAFDKAIALL